MMLQEMVVEVTSSNGFAHKRGHVLNAFLTYTGRVLDTSGIDGFTRLSHISALLIREALFGCILPPNGLCIPQASHCLTSRTCSATYLRIGIGPHPHSLHYGQDANWDE
uniref:Uncharacterized protein n=1 Tax=Romanomermis culicivorax TaxID=13658 RepID=A0A915I7W0_ROMCU